MCLQELGVTIYHLDLCMQWITDFLIRLVTFNITDRCLPHFSLAQHI